MYLTASEKKSKRTRYVNIGYSARNDYDYKEASRLRDLLKYAGLKARLGHSCYVGHRSIEINVWDLTEAAKVFAREGEKFVAECVRETRKAVLGR